MSDSSDKATENAAIDAFRDAHLAPFVARAAELTSAVNDILPGRAEQAGTRLTVVHGRARADISQSILPIATNDDVRIKLEPGDRADAACKLITSIFDAVQKSQSDSGISTSDLVWSLGPEQGYHWQVEAHRRAVEQLASLGYVEQNKTGDEMVFGWQPESAS